MSRMHAQKPLKIGVYLDLTFGLWRELMRGINRFALESGNWMLMPLDIRAGMVSKPVLQKLDGLIGSFRTSVLNVDLPVELADRLVGISYWDRELPIPRVVNDVELTGRWAAEYFLQRGYRNFRFVGDQAYPENWTSTGAAAAFEERLHEDGLACQDLRLTDVEAGGAEIEFPTAVFAYTDIAARQLANLLKLAGISVPEQVAILGVGNDLLEREMSSTPLSSIVVDAQRIGFEAATLLNQMISNVSGCLPTKSLHKIPPLRIETRASSDSLASDDPVLCRALQLIRQEIPRLKSVRQCAELVGVSRRSLEDRFRRELDRTVYKVMLEVRVEFTKRLLLETDMKLARVAEAAGYGDDRMLSVIFRRHTGLTPSSFRKNRRGTPEAGSLRGSTLQSPTYRPLRRESPNA
jgi:LacI family transcriptional regulator